MLLTNAMFHTLNGFEIGSVLRCCLTGLHLV